MKTRTTLIFLLLAAAAVLLAWVNIYAGEVGLSHGRLAHILFSRDLSDVESKIVWDIRLPRVVAAAVLGGALALSGYLLQAFFANPIAGPYVLGISSGAKLAVAALMVAASEFGFGVRAYMSVGAAFIGASIATAFVIFAARKVRSMSVLIVCGVMIGYICSAATELLVSFADDANIVNLHNWSLGSFASVSWNDARWFLPLTAVGVAVSALLAKGVEAYLYGEDYAASLGMSVKKFRGALILTSSLLSATVAAFAGPISFVGIAVPHVARRTLKSADPRVVIPASFLGGAVFCLFCDLLARRMFAPRELSISTVTAVFGAPIVISMLLGKRRA